MRLTTKGRYAVTAMLDLALHSASGPVTLADISARQGISQSYLEQLFGKLKRARLVQSLRGPGGGYALTRAPRSISISEIISGVGEGIDATRCGGIGDCQDGLDLHHARFVDGPVAANRRLPVRDQPRFARRTRRGAGDFAAAGCAGADTIVTTVV